MTRPALRSLALARIDIPFRQRFAHASAARDGTESVLVKATTTTGATGFGEGCPRRYVSGESVESATHFFATLSDAICEQVRNVASLRAFIESQRAAIDANPAAWCAIELALLDAFARERGRSVEAALGLPELAGSFRYTAVLGDSSPADFEQRLARYRSAGFRQFKLKLSGDLGRDRAKLAPFRGRPCETVRVDANNLWRNAREAASYLEALTYPFAAIEEPVRASDFRELVDFADRIDLPVILDESLLRRETLERLPAPTGRWIANLRVSKLGGLLRSLEVVAAARRRGIRILVGAQVGETSLLARAALPVARAAGDLLIGQEGAFGPLLLERDLCDPPLVFGRDGVLQPPAATAGFGVAVWDSDACTTPLRTASRPAARYKQGLAARAEAER